MFRHVLVPVDFTDKSHAAVDVAARLVDADGGRMTLIHVVQTVPGLDLASDPAFYRRLEKTASEKMERLGRALRDVDTAWEASIVVGNRLDEIIAATEPDVDLVVVSSHPVDFSSPETGAGTMSYRIALASPCPVLLLK